MTRHAGPGLAVATLLACGLLALAGPAGAQSPPSPGPPPDPVVPTATPEGPPEPRPTTTPQRPPITTSTPTTPPGGPPEKPPEPPEGPRTCASFGSQSEAQRYFELIRLKSPAQARLLDRDGDGRACAGPVDRGDGSRPDPEAPEVVQTDDDGSRARVSGSQVREVPEGSVDTGAP